MYADDDFIQLSSLQHYMFCPRQCGLIHVYGLWTENRFTAHGRVLHERVDSGEEETRGTDHIIRSLNIYSREYGLAGRADVVEFKDERGNMRPFPVEYKSGKPKPNEMDLVQLCAQVLCLEEMTGISIPEGALYYGKTRHRFNASMTVELRKKTIDAIGAVHDMIRSRSVPDGKYQKKCDTCSLFDECMPKLGRRRIQIFIEGLFTTDETSS